MFLNEKYCKESDFDIFRNKTSKLKPKCPECNQSELSEIEGKLICLNCGTNSNEQIFDNNLEHVKDDKDNHMKSRSNFQINELLPKSSMRTILNGKGISFKQRQNHKWASGNAYKETSKYLIFNIIERKCKEVKICEAVIQYAKELYLGIWDEGKKFRGNNRVGIIGACIYYGCQKRNVYYEISDIAKLMNVKEKYIATGIDIIGEYIYQHKIYSEELLSQNSITETSMAIADKLSEFNSEGIRKKLTKVSRFIEKKMYEINEEQIAISAGCVYYIYNKSINNKQNDFLNKIAQLCKISEESIIIINNYISSFEKRKKNIK